jgi:O-antigen ligase
MVWGGYNTGIGRLLVPGFPEGRLDLFHGLRAFLPVMAAYLAGILLLARRSLPRCAFAGPLGLLALYTLVGLFSSVTLSREPLMALYWAVEYGSVLVVLWAILSDPEPLAGLSRLVNLNWIIVAALAVGLLVGLYFLPNLALPIAIGNLPIGRPFGGEYGATGEILGMAGTRATGFGRYAAVAALVALAKLWQGKRWSKSIWSLVLLASLVGLVLSQARTGVIAFLAGAFVILWLRRGSKILFLAGAFVAMVLLGFVGFYQAFWVYLTRGAPLDPTLSGRTLTWEQGWTLFQESPLLGWGFHADRFFLEGQHMHNAVVHALVQTGLLGTIPFIAALVGAWILVVRLYRDRPRWDLFPLPVEIPGVLLFFTISSITESTVAFYGAAWLLVVPCIAYMQALMSQRREFENRIISFSVSP